MLSPTFPEVHLPHLADVPLPPMMRLRLRHPKGEPIEDIAAAVDEALARSKQLETCAAAPASRWRSAAAASRISRRWWRPRCGT